MNNTFKFLVSWLLILLLLGFGFYWFEWRPIKIRQQCYQKEADAYIKQGAGDLEKNIEGADFVYKICMQSKGLKE